MDFLKAIISGRRGFRAPCAAMLLLFATVTGSSTTSPAEEASRSKQCWTPPELAGRAHEKSVSQNVRRAYVPFPVGQIQSAPLPHGWRGAIRRVELPPGVNKIALTFDFCEQPHEIAGYDSAIVDFLRASETHATFFAGGKWIVSHDERARQVLADPLFEIGNHTWEHRNLRLLSGQRLHDEIGGAQIAYANVHKDLVRDQCIPPDKSNKVVGLTTTPGQPWLFRFPFGACNLESLRAVGDAGLLAVQWDVSSGDPLRTLTAAHMADAVLRNVRPGSIVLFHANGRGWNTSQALRLIIPNLRARGYELVTVTDLLNTKGARPVISQTCYDSRPGDTDHYDNFARRLEATYEAFKLRYASPTPPRPTESDSPILVVPKPVPAIRKKDQSKKDPSDWKNGLER